MTSSPKQHELESGANNGRGSWRLVCRAAALRRGKRVVLADVNLELREGECVSIIGPNGSGKTTLMLALLGLLPTASGSIQLDGRALCRIAPRRRGRWAAYVPQTFDSMPGYTVFDVVAAARYPHVAALAPLSAADLKIVGNAIERCGLTDVRDRPIHAVSAGERQKTLIAAAVAQDAQVMMLDEPSAALDPAHQIELVVLLREWSEKGRGIVLISHDLQLPAALGGRVVALSGGRLVYDGAADEVLQPDRLREIYAAEFAALTSENGARVVLPRMPAYEAG